MSNFSILLNNRLNHLLVMFGLRRQETRWGVVYDSVTKQPLDPVIIKLIDANTGMVVQEGVTDLAGRYNFLARPGKFKILVKKSNYVYPSQLSAGDHDEIYRDLYHSEFFELAGDSDVIPFNIPMDPERNDWNQQAKAGLKSFKHNKKKYRRKAIIAAYWLLLAAALIQAFLRPAVYGYVILGLYLVMFFLAFVTPKPRWWGQVLTRNSGSPAAGVTVELSFKQMPEVVIAKAHVQEDGKFFLRIDPGSYIFQIKQYREDQSPQVLAGQSIKVGFERVVNRNFEI